MKELKDPKDIEVWVGGEDGGSTAVPYPEPKKVSTVVAKKAATSVPPGSASGSASAPSGSQAQLVLRCPLQGVGMRRLRLH